MNVVYSTSDLYAPLAGISLTSLLINNQDIEEIQVIIMDNGITPQNKEKLEKTAKKYNRAIKFVPLTSALDSISVNLQKWNISTFGRLFEASSLPDLDRVVHIDCDTVVHGSLKDLWEMDMSHATIAGASDCLSDEYRLNIGLRSDEAYVNAGVLVMNLQRIRQLGLEKRFLEYIEEKSQFLTYVDQEVLNACVPEDEKIVLSLRYNSYSILHYLTYRQLKCMRHAKNIFSEQEFQDAVNNPIVLHYTGCFLEGTRPWIEGDKHPKKFVFDKYKEDSQWCDLMPWKDKRGLKGKSISLIVKLVPKNLLALIVGYVHGVYVPRKNKIKQERR